MTIERPSDNVDELVVRKSDASFEQCWAKISKSRCRCQSENLDHFVVPSVLSPKHTQLSHLAKEGESDVGGVQTSCRNATRLNAGAYLLNA